MLSIAKLSTGQEDYFLEVEHERVDAAADESDGVLRQPAGGIRHRAMGTRILLFVREQKTFELGTQPSTFLGPVEYVDHRGERPAASPAAMLAACS